MFVFSKICFGRSVHALLLPIVKSLFGIDDIAVGVLGAGLLGGIASFFGGSRTNAANLQATRETNQANKEIAAQTNQTQIQLMREQNDWNRAQWDLENKYNAPDKQVQRYLRAGINPAFAEGLGNGNSFQGLQSAPAPSLAVPEMKAASFINPWQDFATGLTATANAMKAKADIAKAKSDIRNDTKMTDQQIKESESRIDKIIADTQNVKKLTQAQYDEVVQRIKNMRTENKGKDVENRYKKAELSILEAQADSLKEIPKIQLVKALEDLRGARNQNNYDVWLQAESKRLGLDPVAHSALDAVGRKVFSGLFERGFKVKNFITDYFGKSDKNLKALLRGQWNALWEDVE